MKGLLLKDFYLLLKNCKSYLFFTIFLEAFCFVIGYGTSFALLYPCLFASTIPILLLSLDERSGWSSYERILPYKPWMSVISKYLMGLLGQTAVLLLSLIIEGIRSCFQEDFRLYSPSNLLIAVGFLFLLPAAVSYPLVFYFGSEKARIIRGLFTGLLVIFLPFAVDNSSLIENELGRLYYFMPSFCLVALALYLLSILLSIVLYRIRKA